MRINEMNNEISPETGRDADAVDVGVAQLDGLLERAVVETDRRAKIALTRDAEALASRLEGWL